MPLTAHGEQSALRSHRTPNTAASTASLPASVTIMIRPSGGVGCESSRCDLGQREQIFFGKSEIKDSTALSTNRPTGKSLEPVLLSAAVARMDRDRGEPHDSSPPTPPYIRVRIRRFDRLSWLGTATVARPSDLSEAFDRAMASAGLLLSRQGPRGLPAACAA